MWTKQEEGLNLPAPLCWHLHFLRLCKSHPIISQILGGCYWILFLSLFLNCNDEAYKKKYKTVVSFRYSGTGVPGNTSMYRVSFMCVSIFSALRRAIPAHPQAHYCLQSYKNTLVTLLPSWEWPVFSVGLPLTPISDTEANTPLMHRHLKPSISPIRTISWTLSRVGQ